MTTRRRTATTITTVWPLSRPLVQEGVRGESAPYSKLERVIWDTNETGVEIQPIVFGALEDWRLVVKKPRVFVLRCRVSQRCRCLAPLSARVVLTLRSLINILVLAGFVPRWHRSPQVSACSSESAWSGGRLSKARLFTSSSRFQRVFFPRNKKIRNWSSEFSSG